MISRHQTEAFLHAIERGHTVTDACKGSGISTTTVYRWRGNPAQSPLVRAFVDAWDAAEFHGIDRHLAVIEQADDWRCSMKFLAHKRPAAFSSSPTESGLDEKLAAYLQRIDDGEATHTENTAEQALAAISGISPTDPAEALADDVTTEALIAFIAQMHEA